MLHDITPPKLATSFSNLTLSQTIAVGTANVTLGGTISAAGPVYQANGALVHVAINGVTHDATISGGAGGDYGSWLGGFTFAPGADTTPEGDPDGDGMSNQAEYAIGHGHPQCRQTAERVEAVHARHGRVMNSLPTGRPCFSKKHHLNHYVK